MSDFIQSTRRHFDGATDALFGALRSGEELTANLVAEDSLYLRFNANKVRQNTDVEQRSVSIKLQLKGRTVEKSRTLSGRLDADRASLLRLLDDARAEAKQLPPDPNQVPMQNNGESAEEFRAPLLPAEEIVRSVADAAEGQDLAGLYAGGPAIRANRNSKGQRHWFATENFFLDYSLYDGPKAAKAIYSGARWSHDDWRASVHHTRGQLALLSRPKIAVKPGQYRTYLAPGAVVELCRMMGWGALSGGAWKQGTSAFKKFADGETKLSPLFSLRENFGLGLTPRFNELGEVAPAQLPLIEKGELKALLVSSRTAKEFGLKANFASGSEAPRAMEVLGGTLEEKDVLKALDTGLYLSNLHYLNWSDPVSARITGMTRYACFWVENGAIAGPIQDLRWDESLYECLGPKLQALTSHGHIDPDTGTYFHRALGGARAPGALIDRFTFTL